MQIVSSLYTNSITNCKESLPRPPLQAPFQEHHCSVFTEQQRIKSKSLFWRIAKPKSGGNPLPDSWRTKIQMFPF